MDKQAATGIPVNVQASYPPQHVALGEGQWNTGLCDCCDDVPRCCLTFWCPCITFGQVAEIVDKGSTSCGTAGALYALILAFTGCQCIYSCMYRTKMRQQYGIPGDQVGDCCLHFCCECCAISQMSRELTIRGYDVPLGWDGNMAKNNQGVYMAPAAPACGAAGTVYGMLYVFTLCQCFYTCMYRTKLREQYNIPGDQVGDFCTHLFCERCAMSQMYRELTFRGFNVPLGWHGNMAKNNQANQQGAYLAPTAPRGMTR
ncbi:hypothetical protein V2J09_023884 [Rumex salicifolius]